MLTKNNRYFSVFIVAYLLIASVIIVFKRTDIFPWIGECNPRGYDGGHFMAYCNSEKYGDFEHRAYWSGTDPVSMDFVKKADVLFLGNSRTQYAFSTSAIKDYFHSSDIAHYVFGFGIGSLSLVPEKMFEKHEIQPKVLVINADPFFSERFGGVNQKMIQTDFKTKWEFAAKGWMQKLQHRTCSNGKQGEYLFDLMCSGSSETLYREPKTGHWKTDYYRPNKEIPVTYTDSLMWYLNEAIPRAEQFIEKTGLNRKCIIVTATPKTSTPLMYAQKIAQEMGVVSILPMVRGLKTIDDSHLDDESAQRWSSAFIEKAAPYIEACTRDATNIDN